MFAVNKNVTEVTKLLVEDIMSGIFDYNYYLNQPGGYGNYRDVLIHLFKRMDTNASYGIVLFNNGGRMCHVIQFYTNSKEIYVDGKPSSVFLEQFKQPVDDRNAVIDGHIKTIIERVRHILKTIDNSSEFSDFDTLVLDFCANHKIDINRPAASENHILFCKFLEYTLREHYVYPDEINDYKLSLIAQLCKQK